MKIGQPNQEARQLFIKAIVRSAITDKEYIQIPLTEMGDGTDRLRAEKPHTNGQSS